MIKKIVFSSYFLIIPLLIIGISQGFTSFPVALFALLPLLFITSRHTVAIFFLMYGGALGGITRYMFPGIPIYGLLLELFGILLMWPIITDLFKHNGKALIGLFFTLAFFGVFYLIGPQTSFAKDKYISMCTHGLFMLFGYYCFERSRKVDAEGLTRILLLASVCLYTYAITAANMTRGSLFDFNWFRSQCEWFEYTNDGKGLLVGYQQTGMLALFAIAIFLSQDNLNLSKVFFYSACSALLVLTSGSRQAIIGVALIIVLRFVVFRTDTLNNRNLIGKVLWISVGFVAAYFFISFFFNNINSDVISRTLTEGDEGRMAIYLESLSIFRDHPLLGTGLGGFQSITGRPWSHNFFLELLCETGLVGLLASLIILISPLIRKKQGFLHISASNLFYFLIVMAIFIRVMVSSDLRESIELFSAVFAITATKVTPPLHQNTTNSIG